MGGSCSSVAFGLIQTECESTNKILSINDTVIENVTNIMTSTTNQAVTQLNVNQIITINAGSIDCANLNIGNKVSIDVVVNQEINEVARTQLIAAISNVTEWDAVQDNTELTGWFSNPAASQVNDVEVANYFKSLTQQTLTLERLNTITNSMYIDQEITLNVNQLSGTNCNITNDVMVKVFVSQALYAVLDAFQSSDYELETNLKLKQSLSRENRGIFESFFGSKKGKFTMVAVVLGGILVIGGVIFAIVMSSKKKSGGGGSGTTIITPAPIPETISPPQVPQTPSVQVETTRTVQVPINGTVQLPVLNGSVSTNGSRTVQVPILNSSVNGNRLTGRVFTQNSRQPT